MNKNIIDLTGKKYGHLTVVGISSASKPKYLKWECLCDCGSSTAHKGYYLKNGLSKTCGYSCKYRGNVTHHKSKTPEYRSYVSMLYRCNNPNARGYFNYGGRGIKVCDKWDKSFTNFLEDMGEKPTKKHQIERIDTNKDYTPENCKWATVKEQCNNKRNNTLLTHKGETKTLSEWAASTGIKYTTLSERIRRNWTLERALSERPEMHHLFR